MKPLKLTIEGIRSFSERSEIDFEAVGKSGLFGIFGNTGSGKSTILDGMIIALYGALPGLQLGEIVSARKQKAFASLDFEISVKGERKRYLVERNIDLKKDGSATARAKLLERSGEGWTVITDKRVTDEIEGIIGLEINEFTKCIILPQGEFSQFVKARATERVSIIERLFDLGKYGERFTAKLKSKIFKSESELTRLGGELAPYLEATEEAVKESEKLIKDAEKELERATKELEEVEKERESGREFSKISAELISLDEKIKEFESKKSEIEKTKELLSKRGVAVKIAEADDERKRAQKEFEIAAERVVAAKGELKKAEEEAQKSVEEYNKIPSYEEDRDKYSKLSAGLDALRPDYLKLKDIEGKNEDLRKQYKLLTQSLKAADGELTANNAAINDNAKEIERLEKLCDFSVALKEVGDRALYGEFKGQTEYYQNRLKEVEKFADGGKLYSEIVSEYGRKLEEYAAKTAALGIAESGFGSVGERIKELQANLEKLDKARKIKEVLTKTDKEINQKRQNISVEIKDVEDEGKRNAETASEIRKKIERLIAKADDFGSESARVKTLAEAAAESLRKVRLNYEKSKAEVDEKSGKLSEEKGNLKAKTDIFGAAETALKGLFTESVPSVDEARSVLSALLDEEGARRKVADFEANLRADLKRREELSEKLAEVGFSAQKYADTEQKCAAVSQTVKNLHEILGNYKNNASILSQNFSKRCIIEKQITSENKRRATLDKLERAVGNRKFIEYVAAEYLSDVADAASDTLLYLTGGKYDVTYRDKLADETKNGFYVHDNLNGGVERSVASLSGGETFLVSLSLALALSAEICAKSDRPMEFFFLDEGFGTLDDELVDTVMDGLEKLRGKNGEFTIGVISHLAAMKARIECRINVTAANGDKGSSVSVSI